jgi:hypothetical protein
VLIALIVKLLGPFGALMGLVSGRFPLRFLWVNVTNDIVWWIPFARTLGVVYRRQSPDPAQPMSLYRRWIGPALDELTRRVRRFHHSHQPMEVRGALRVTRGDSVIGTWLTDRAGFPRSQEALPVSQVVEPSARGEIWGRSFGRTAIDSGNSSMACWPRAAAHSSSTCSRALWRSRAKLPTFGPFLSPSVYAHGIDQGSAIAVAVRVSCHHLAS